MIKVGDLVIVERKGLIVTPALESGVKGGVGRKYFKEMMSLVEEGVLDGFECVSYAF